MAIYRLSASIIGRSNGRSVTAAAAYRSAGELRDERTGSTHDYTRKQGVIHTEILAPENAPAWMLDRQALWNAVEIAEKRKDAQLAREIQLALPHELTEAERLDLVRSFVQAEFVGRGMIADIAIHEPHRLGDDRNHHAHVLLTMRELTGEGFGKKAREWNETPQLEAWREGWAEHVNRTLERAGREERVDHRSYEDQGIDREAEPKQGPVATEMERMGIETHAGNDRRAVKERNAERESLEYEDRILALEADRLERLQTIETANEAIHKIVETLGAVDQSRTRSQQREEQQEQHQVERTRLNEQQQFRAGHQQQAFETRCKAEFETLAQTQKRQAFDEDRTRELDERQRRKTLFGRLKAAWGSVGKFLNPEKARQEEQQRRQEAVQFRNARQVREQSEIEELKSNQQQWRDEMEAERERIEQEESKQIEERQKSERERLSTPAKWRERQQDREADQERGFGDRRNREHDRNRNRDRDDDERDR